MSPETRFLPGDGGWVELYSVAIQLHRIRRGLSPIGWLPLAWHAHSLATRFHGQHRR